MQQRYKQSTEQSEGDNTVRKDGVKPKQDTPPQLSPHKEDKTFLILQNEVMQCTQFRGDQKRTLEIWCVFYFLLIS